MSFRRFLPLAALLVTAAAPPAARDLPVDVSNVRVAKGRVHVDVCTEATFVSTKLSCPFAASAVARAGTTTVVVTGLPPGRYAVQAFLDENSNNKVDMALFGKVPKEGVGFSNDPKIGFGPPKFADAAFAHQGADQHIKLTLHYYL